MDPNLQTALVAFGGAVLGGLATFLGSVWQSRKDHQRWKQEQAARRAQAAREGISSFLTDIAGWEAAIGERYYYYKSKPPGERVSGQSPEFVQTGLRGIVYKANALALIIPDVLIQSQLGHVEIARKAVEDRLLPLALGTRDLGFEEFDELTQAVKAEVQKLRGLVAGWDGTVSEP
ncbi:hypothetical protein GCM10029992_35850 [Glycomyces albus]